MADATDFYQRRRSGDARYNDFDPTNPTDSAILRIVEMGFTPYEARDALRKTDNGVNHCIYLAIEYLLSSSSVTSASTRNSPAPTPGTPSSSDREPWEWFTSLYKAGPKTAE
jgi:hypothetical protein